MLQEKRRLFQQVVDDLSVNGVAKHLSMDELYSLFDLPRR